MPEGPSIVILKEEVQLFAGKKILEVTGNTKEDKALLNGKKVVSFESWGKHFLIRLQGLTVKIHFLLFGSYSINEMRKPNPRLHLKFSNGDLYLYSCSVKLFTEDPDAVYDWSADVMNDNWSPAKARKKLKALPDALACDALLNQEIFAGVGNIIKNEVLFRIRVHPESLIGALPPRKLTELIAEARKYSFQFLEWKKAFELKKHWLAHTKTCCPRCHIPFVKEKHLGKTKRRAFFCENCQVRYPQPAILAPRLPPSRKILLKCAGQGNVVPAKRSGGKRSIPL